MKLNLQQLQQQISDAQLAIAKLELEPLQIINDEISKIDLSALLTVINANAELLTAERKQQAMNIVTVLTHSPAFLLQEAAQTEARIAAQEAFASEAVIEAVVVEPPVED